MALISKPVLPLGKLGLPVVQRGRTMVEFGFPVDKLRFLLLEPGFPLVDLRFAEAELGQLLAKGGSPRGQPRLPLGKLGFLLPQLSLVLAHMPAQHGFPLGELGLAVGELGFPLLQRAGPGTKFRIGTAKVSVFRDVSG
ncbi:hypothetical protein [Mycobacterium sp.]|uniref:hypothetical protein n=1 Tax=Mycobacterium sp. TaxID=1785 RepID=UPI003450804B